MNSRTLILFLTLVSNYSLIAMGYEQPQLRFTAMPTWEPTPQIINNLILSTPLHRAVFFEDIDKIISLINKKVPVNAQNSDGETPLHFAAEIVDAKKRNKIYQILVQAGAEQHLSDYLNRTPYRKMCLHNKRDMRMNMAVRSFERLTVEG